MNCSYCNKPFKEAEQIINIDDAIYFTSKEHKSEVELLGNIAKLHRSCYYECDDP